MTARGPVNQLYRARLMQNEAINKEIEQREKLLRVISGCSSISGCSAGDQQTVIKSLRVSRFIFDWMTDFCPARQEKIRLLFH